MDAVGADLSARVRQGVPLAPYTTLRVGGPADALIVVETEDELVRAAAAAQTIGIPHFILAGGSNLCISDRGIRGLVIRNRARECTLGERTRVASGHALMALALSAAEAGLSGLEFAIGIPGSVGGALVSNAGAYRRSIAPLVRRLRIVVSGEEQWVEPEWMDFGYRDSRLRRSDGACACLVGAELELTPRPRAEILAEARQYQHNRVHRQPWGPSAGSFFKNVCDRELAQRLPNLPEPLRQAGVVPAGYLSEACGCRGLRNGGAQISPRHGNFIINTGGATAADVRGLAEEVKHRVYERFGARLEEEVIYAGEW
jgi:UDP-N-acetylmuramate dehydrogenase